MVKQNKILLYVGLAIQFSFLTNPAYTQQTADFPDEIYYKTHKMSFNQRYFFYVHDGRLWIKSNHLQTGKRGQWQLFGKNGLPYDFKEDKELSIDYVDQISVDGNIIAVISKQRKIYQTIEGLKDIDQQDWTEEWGFPFGFGPGLHLPTDILDWTISYADPIKHKYYIDSNKNKIYHFCTTCYVLSPNGQEIHIADPWTPADWGYQLGGPNQGRFIAQSISASGSVIFLMNKYGDMYTRQNDFDILGANPLNFYSYKPQKHEEGLFDHDILRGVPPLPWKKQPKINGRITSRITIFFTGQGSNTRILRVEGMDKQGNRGYFEKNINASHWRFYALDNPPPPLPFINNTIEDYSAITSGPTRTFTYHGYLDAKKKHKMILEDFNFHCSPNILKIHIREDEWIYLNLHSRFDFRIDTRDNPGMDGEYFSQTGAIEIPPQDAKSFHTKQVLREYLDYWPHQTVFLNICLMVKQDKILIKRQDAGQPKPIWEFKQK